MLPFLQAKVTRKVSTYLVAHGCIYLFYDVMQLRCASVHVPYGIIAKNSILE
jgi:hypothetical protein